MDIFLSKNIIDSNWFLTINFFTFFKDFRWLILIAALIIIILILLIIVLKITINKKTKALSQALIKAQESDQLKSVFLRNLSHEIRTPLNGISGFSLLLQDDELDLNTRVRYTDLIISSGRQLMSIVDNILAVSLLETRQEKINISRVNVNDMLDDLFSVYNKSLDEKGVEFTLHKDLNHKQAMLNTDHVKLDQILSNLLSNAVKFTANGFIEMGYSLKQEILEFYIKDSGIGIDNSQREKIFMIFSQEDNSSKRRYEGAGLGLSISKGYIELLGGKIYFDSEKGQGTTFYFTIPYQIQ
jgi:signal transduction histidine kinase